MEVRIKLVRALTTRFFPALFVSVLGLSRSGELVCAVGTSFGRLLLGSDFYVESTVSNYRWGAVRLEQCKERAFTVSILTIKH